MRRGVRLRDGGGIVGLGQLLAESWGPLEADFLRFYGRDLRVDLLHMGARRLWTLVSQLPDDARVWAVRNAEKDDSQPVDELAERRDRRVTRDPREIASFLGLTMGGG